MSRLTRRASPAFAGSGLTGPVVLPTDAGYDAGRHDFNRRFNVFPQAIVYCQTAEDVANSVTWARQQKSPLAVRSGGHSYEGFSLSPGLIIDLSDLNAVAVDSSSGRVSVQPGIRLLPLYAQLAAAGLTISGGTCAGVGVSGLTLGGGVGFLTRKWGITCDSLVALDMVDASGHLLRADASQNPDLFWACRGGGGSFGVVTRLEFQAQPIDQVVLVRAEWPIDAAAPVLAAWQQYAPDWPDEFTTALSITSGLSGSASLDGVSLGEEDAVREMLESLTAAAPPSDLTISTVQWAEAADRLSEQSTLPFFKAKSDYVRTSLPDDGIDTIIKWLTGSPSESNALQFLAQGGAANRVPVDATAYPHRAGALFIMQYLAHWSDPADEARELAWIGDFHASMRPYVSGFAYSNMCDLDLDDWQHAYYGDNFERLQRVKTAYDPSDVFHFAQSIPPLGVS